MRKLSEDVRLTAYRKYLRIYGDARKAAEQGQASVASLTLSRALLHVPPICAAFQGEEIPRGREVADWLNGRSESFFQEYRTAIARGPLGERLSAAQTVTQNLQIFIPPEEGGWETGRMRFGRGFSTEDLFFAESDSCFLRIWDRLWDREEILPGLGRFARRIESGGYSTGQDYEGAFLESFKDCPTVQGIVLFGSNAADPSGTWHRSEGRDVDLAFVARGTWFRRAIFENEDVMLDIVRLPLELIRRGVEKQDDFIHNALVKARIIRDDTGSLRTFQEVVRSNYPKGKDPLQGEERERARQNIRDWVSWGSASSGSSLPARWLNLEMACREILRQGYRVSGNWFPPDQDLCRSLLQRDASMGSLLEEYAGTTDPEEAAERLRSIASAYLNGKGVGT